MWLKGCRRSRCGWGKPSGWKSWFYHHRTYLTQAITRTIPVNEFFVRLNSLIGKLILSQVNQCNIRFFTWCILITTYLSLDSNKIKRKFNWKTDLETKLRHSIDENIVLILDWHIVNKWNDWGNHKLSSKLLNHPEIKLINFGFCEESHEFFLAYGKFPILQNKWHWFQFIWKHAWISSDFHIAPGVDY